MKTTRGTGFGWEIIRFISHPTVLRPDLKNVYSYLLLGRIMTTNNAITAITKLDKVTMTSVFLPSPKKSSLFVIVEVTPRTAGGVDFPSKGLVNGFVVGQSQDSSVGFNVVALGSCVVRRGLGAKDGVMS